MAKFPFEDHAAVSAAPAAARLVSAAEVDDGNVLPWRPDDEYASEVLFHAVSSSSSALSGSGNDGQRLSHLQSIINADIGREGEFGRGMIVFGQRTVDEPDVFPPELWQLFLQPSLTALGEKYRPVCVGRAWRRLSTAEAMRQWRPRLEEVTER